MFYIQTYNQPLLLQLMHEGHVPYGTHLIPHLLVFQSDILKLVFNF